MNLYIISGISILLFIFDSISKLVAFNILQEKSYQIIPWLFSLHYVENPGIAFSIPLTGIVLKVLTVILISGIIWYYFHEERKKSSKLIDISFAFILAWALWNAWERLYKWYVIDFIDLEFFAIFNLADSYITLWAMGIILYYIKHR